MYVYIYMYIYIYLSLNPLFNHDFPPAWPFGGKDHIFRHGQIVCYCSYVSLYHTMYFYVYIYGWFLVIAMK